MLKFQCFSSIVEIKKKKTLSKKAKNIFVFISMHIKINFGDNKQYKKA